MAIYHLSMSLIRRSKNRSAVAAAAYRSGEALYDFNENKTWDFTKKSNVDHTLIAGGWEKDRELLWNVVEFVEKRKNSRTAREINAALPIELSREAMIGLTHDFVKVLLKKYPVIADVAFHNLSGHNPHIHIMMTTRKFEGGIKFSHKIRDLDKKSFLKRLRKMWADACNAYLAYFRFDARVDHRSYEVQGISQPPGFHLGPFAAKIEKAGEHSKRRDFHDDWVSRLEKIKKKKESEEIDSFSTVELIVIDEVINAENTKPFLADSDEILLVHSTPEGDNDYDGEDRKMGI